MKTNTKKTGGCECHVCVKCSSIDYKLIIRHTISAKRHQIGNQIGKASTQHNHLSTTTLQHHTLPQNKSSKR